MSNSDKPTSDSGVESLSNRLKNTSVSCSNDDDKIDKLPDKPDFLKPDTGSPVSPLRTSRLGRPAPTTTTTTTTTSSSSSSSDSVSGRAAQNPVSKRHSGELTDTSPRTGPTKTRPRHVRSNSCGSSGSHPVSHSGSGGGGSVNSPVMNVLPAGNICPSGRIQKTGMMTRQSPRDHTLGSGNVNYGHGNIIRTVGGVVTGGPSGGDPGRKVSGNFDPAEIKRVGNEEYKRGNFSEALALYDKAISLSPADASCRSNQAAALTGLGRIGEAIKACEEAVRLDPSYARAHLRLGCLFTRLGLIENARRHLLYAGLQPGAAEMCKLHEVEKHVIRCSDSRKIGDWKRVLREGDAAIAAGADCSPQLFTCRAECLLKLQQLDDIDSIISNVPKLNHVPHSCSQSKFFGMFSEAYLFYVRAQIEMALGRFDNAITFAEKAAKYDPRDIEVTSLLNNVKLVARACARGNDLFKSERFTEACAAYGEGLKLDSSNSVLYCNRAACWFKLGLWERSIEDCNLALRIQPNYTKALLRKAASNSKLERWVEAVKDYELLRKKLPHDIEIAESLFHAQVALKKSRGEEVYNMKFGGDVEEVSGLDQFKSQVYSPGVSVVHFKLASDPQCKRLFPLLSTLCGRYPSIKFLNVDIEGCPDVANAENVRIVPTFKIYRNGSRVKEIVNPTTEVLEASVRHYSF